MYKYHFFSISLIGLILLSCANISVVYAQCKWDKLGVVCTNKNETTNFGNPAIYNPDAILYREELVTQTLNVKWWYDYMPQVPHPDAFSGTNDRKMFGYWKPSASATTASITAAAAAAKNSVYGQAGPVYWYIGNEVNDAGQANLTPEQYVPLFKKYADAIKAGDSGAKIAGPAILNWTLGTGNQQGKIWYTNFRNLYKNTYGVFPQLDVFNIHIYDFTDWPGINADWVKAEYQRVITSLNGWSELANKKVWVTEFGVPPFSTASVSQRITFMETMCNYFQGQSRMERMFWFEGHPDVGAASWTATTSLTNNSGNLTTIGAAFANLAQSWKDACYPPAVTINCPANIIVTASSGASCKNVTYSTPTATTNCTTSGITITRISGPASGSCFPIGNTTVCYKAIDQCGKTKTCCFTVTVESGLSCPAETTLTGATNITSTSAKINWSAAPGATYYHYAICKPGEAWTYYYFQSATQNYRVFNSLEPNTTYAYTAMNSCPNATWGNSSNWYVTFKTNPSLQGANDRSNSTNPDIAPLLPLGGLYTNKETTDNKQKDFIEYHNNHFDNITIFPNPAQENVSISIPGSFLTESFEGAALQICITDISGKIIAQYNMGQSQMSIFDIDCASWPSGLYIARVSRGEKSSIAKFIIK